MSMRKSRAGGFTLIELMVAIAAMALLALMSWRGLDGMTRAQSLNRDRGDAVLTLQTTLSQWGADLDAIVAPAQIQPISWNGRVLRLTRRSTNGERPALQVVAWSVRTDAGSGPGAGTRWRRWQSPDIDTRAGWQQAWDQASAWAQDGNGSALGGEVALMPVDAWQMFYYNGTGWINAGSDGGSSNSAFVIPEGVRLVLTLPPGPGLAGVLTRDWVRPTATVAKS
ncbi:PulJ/GspJ family protein [Variovorax sp. RHLX14]|uniref:PulJ/GspJ family protein n=1 Tax=Variovorax sp. RHLX14 TaxID=1259731 RepID=UPI003F46B9B3